MPRTFIIKIFLLCSFILLIPKASCVYAYQVELDYYSHVTKDTVTPEGIYHQAVIYLNAPTEVMKNISYVNYQLAGNFYRKSIVVRSQAHNFQLTVDALTHFFVNAQVHFAEGNNTTITKYIILGTNKPYFAPVHQVSISHDILKTPANSKHDNTYTIALFLEGPADELAQVDKVEYYFPSSFSKAPITVYSPSTNFELQQKLTQQSSIQAYVYFKDGTVTELVRFAYFKYY